MHGPRPLAPDRAAAAADAASTAYAGAAPAGGVVAWYAEGFSDGIGDRLQLFESGGPGLELLRFNRRLTANPRFEPALRARLRQLEAFRHPGFARIRRITMLDDPGPQLGLVSELITGERLSHVLRTARLARVRPNAGAAVHLLREVVPPLAALHGQGRASHGALTPDRIVITPGGALIVTEHVLATAIEQLGLSAFELWNSFGIACGSPRGVLEPQSDVTQLALVAISLLVDRPLRATDYPLRLGPLVTEATGRAPEFYGRPLRAWLSRALGLDGRGFADAVEALTALEALFADIAASWDDALLPSGAPAETALAPRPSEHAVSVPASPRPATIGLGLSDPAPLALPPHVAAQVATQARVVRRLRRATTALGIVALAEAAGLVLILSRPPAQAVVGAVQSRQVTSVADPPVDAPVVPRAEAAVVGTSLTAASGRGSGRADRTAPGASGEGPVSGEALRPATSEDRAEERTSSSLPTADPTAIGWVAIDSDDEVRVYANGRLLGSVAHGRFRLPAGEHTITIVNQSRGLRSSRSVHVVAGQSVAIAVPRSRN